MRSIFLCAIGLLLGLLWLAGCGGGSSNLYNANNTPGVGAPGTVRLLLSDAPLDNASAVNIQIVRIDLLYDGKDDSEMHGDSGDGDMNGGGDVDGGGGDMHGGDTDGGGMAAVRTVAPRTATRDGAEDVEVEDDDVPITLYQGSTVVNLLSLANQPLNNLLQLSQVPVPSGEYKGLVLYLGTENSVVLSDGTVQPLTVPSGKVMFPLHDTYVSPGETEPIMLDFDLSAPGALTTDGQSWVLHPVLHISSMQHTGSVTGVLGVPEGFTPTSDFEVKISIPTADDEVETEVELEHDEMMDNPYAFYLHGVPAGTYTVTFHVEYGEQTATFTAPVTVTEGGTADMGTVPVTGITF